jgi:hypothetical protein
MKECVARRWTSIVLSVLAAVVALLLNQASLQAAERPVALHIDRAVPADEAAAIAGSAGTVPELRAAVLMRGTHDDGLGLLPAGRTLLTNQAPLNGSGFADIGAPLQGLGDSSSVDWGDYDGDGDLDILLAGYTDDSPNYIATVYRNDGADTFVAAITDTLTGVDFPSVAWGDYDNDGDLDILLTGEDSGYEPVTTIYRNDGAGAFTAAVTDTLVGIYNGSVAWGDYDNDGDLDILLTGSTGAYMPRTAVVYRNDGADVFTAAVTGTLTGVSSGSVAWGDYDNDGDLDILLTGSTGLYMSNVATVYRNDGGDTFTVAVTETLTAVAHSSVAWGDYDGDGDLDILLTGNTASLGLDPVTTLYRNDGDDTFTVAITETDTLSDVLSSSVAWGDYDNDGDLDILLSGFTYSWGEVSKVYRNDLNVANLLPGTPTGAAAQVNGTEVELSWLAPPPTCTTPITALTYNLYVGTAPGRVDIVSPMAFTTSNGYTNGLRLLPAMGNAQQTTTHVLRGLPPGTYYWGVQAIDHAFAGSSFSEEKSFVVQDVQYLLTVEKAGTGVGTVSSTPAGIDCGADCSESFAYGTVVTLTATTPESSTFAGWSGAGCSGTGDCVVRVEQAETVTATFITYRVYLPLVRRE